MLKFNGIRIHEALRDSSLPVESVDATGEEVDFNISKVTFSRELTPQEITDAETIIATFDFSEAARDAWVEDLQPDRKQIRERAIEAVNTLQTIRDNHDSLTAAQVRDAIGELARNQIHIIKHIARDM